MPSPNSLPHSSEKHEIWDLRDALQRARHREAHLVIQLEMARNANASIVKDYVDSMQREMALNNALAAAEERAIFAEMHLRIAQSKLTPALDDKGRSEDLLAAGIRVIERLEGQHAFELGLVAEGVTVAAINNARQPWVEEEKTHFMNGCKELLGAPQPKIINVFDLTTSEGRTESQILTPPQEEELQEHQGPEDPFTPPRQVHRRKLTDYDGALRQLLGAEEAKKLISVAHANGNMPVSPSPVRR